MNGKWTGNGEEEEEEQHNTTQHNQTKPNQTKERKKNHGESLIKLDYLCVCVCFSLFLSFLLLFCIAGRRE